MPKRRIFVALPLSEEIRPEAVSIAKKYQKLPIRWLKPGYLHFTLIPPWYAEEEKISWVKKNIKETAENQKSFPGWLLKIIPGPDPKRPRLIWAEGKTPKDLVKLNTELEARFEQKPEKRPPKLHLTLARFKEGARIKVEEKIDWKIYFDKIELWESHLKPGGAEYEVLASYELAR